jgi:hypothetical protein
LISNYFLINQNALFIRPTDSALVTVINNNIVSLNQGHNIFDTKKRMKASMNELAAAKLLNFQKQEILLNNVTVQLQTNQLEACREQLEEYCQTNTNEDDHRLLLIQVTLLKKEKKFEEAKKLLEPKIQPHDNRKNLELILALGRILIEQNELHSFADLLTRFPFLCKHVGIVSMVSALLFNVRYKSDAFETLEHAISWFEQNEVRFLFKFLSNHGCN